MTEDLISVIIPVYNVERYLATCLDSVISQSYHNLEIIVIDDGSSDFSLQIAETYAAKDDRIKLYSFQNEGLAEARNRGLKVASAEFVTFVDADDMLLPKSLEILHRTIINHEADIVEGKTIKGKIFKEYIIPEKFSYSVYNSQEAIEDTLYQKNILASAWGKLFKTRLFEDITFSKGLIYEDLDIFYQLFDKADKIIKIDFPVYFYRDTEGSILNTWSPKRLDVLKVTENLENYISERYPQIIKAAQDRRLSASFNMFALCSLYKDKENANKCWNLIKETRLNSLTNPKVRFKNKAGILLSYLGSRPFALLSKIIYK